MNIYLKTLLKSAQILLLGAVVGMIIALALSFLRPLEYTSSMTLLIVQRGNAVNDPYTAFKSVELIGDNLSQVLYTSAFFDRVLEVDPSIDRSIFSANEVAKRKEWRKMVGAEVARGTGFLKITVYHPNVATATKLVQAIGQVFMQEGWKYVNASIDIKLVDAPVQSQFPERPNLAINAVLGFLAGLFAATGYVLQKKNLLRRVIAQLSP